MNYYNIIRIKWLSQNKKMVNILDTLIKKNMPKD